MYLMKFCVYPDPVWENSEFPSSLTRLYTTENTLMYPIFEDENIHIPTETFFLLLLFIFFFSLAKYLAELW